MFGNLLKLYDMSPDEIDKMLTDLAMQGTAPRMEEGPPPMLPQGPQMSQGPQQMQRPPMPQQKLPPVQPAQRPAPVMQTAAPPFENPYLGGNRNG